MPEQLRTFNLRKEFTFYTEPYIDSYTTNSTFELTNFKQNNITVHEPFYVAGIKASYYQSRDAFFNSYPQTTQRIVIDSGDGLTIQYSGTLSNIPVLRNDVVFSGITSTNAALMLKDDGAGLLTGDGTGTIDYVSGVYVLNFAVAPAAGSSIYSQTFPYVAGKPTSVMFFADTFTLRPIPDGVYTVNFEVNVKPTELINASDQPDLWELWNYMSYGAAKSVFEDRQDFESISSIMSRFLELQNLALRRTIVQNLDQRAATIFSGTSLTRFNKFFPFNSQF
jgi:hypothetical protein